MVDAPSEVRICEKEEEEEEEEEEEVVQMATPWLSISSWTSAVSLEKSISSDNQASSH
jgi:hypothetical protein